MFFYNFVFLIIALLSSSRGFFGRFFVGCCLFAVLFFFIGLRNEVGTDWWNYLAMYQESSTSSFIGFLGRSDYGFTTLIYLSNHLFDSYSVLIAISSSVFLLGIVQLSLARKVNTFLFLVTAFPYLIMVVAPNYIRQAMSIGMLCSAVYVLDRGMLVSAIVFSLLSAIFHATGVVTLFIIAYCRYGISRRFLGFALISFLLTFAVFHDRILQKLMFHLYSFDNESTGVLLRLALYSIPFLIYLIFGKSFLYSQVFSKFIFLSFILYCFCFFLVKIDSVVADRVAIYTIPAQCLIMSGLFHVKFDVAFRVLSVTLLFLYALFQINFWLVFSVWAEVAWLPYDNIFYHLF